MHTARDWWSLANMWAGQLKELSPDAEAYQILRLKSNWTHCAERSAAYYDAARSILFDIIDGGYGS